MKRLHFLLIASLLFLLFSCDTEEKIGSIRINNTSDTWYIIAVSITPSTDEYWGDDLLGNDIIDTGESYIFELSPGIYDVLVVDNEEYMEDIYEINVGAGQMVDIFYDGWDLTTVSSGTRTLDSNISEREINKEFQPGSKK